MYQRLKTPGDVQYLHPGTLLIKYPLTGKIPEEIDLSEPDGFDLYEVQSVEEDTVRLLFRPDIEPGQRPASNAETNNTAAQTLSRFIIKETNSLIQEENWWHNEELVPG